MNHQNYRKPEVVEEFTTIPLARKTMLKHLKESFSEDEWTLFQEMKFKFDGENYPTAIENTTAMVMEAFQPEIDSSRKKFVVISALYFSQFNIHTPNGK